MSSYSSNFYGISPSAPTMKLESYDDSKISNFVCKSKVVHRDNKKVKKFLNCLNPYGNTGGNVITKAVLPNEF
jgi:hypothetical protein